MENSGTYILLKCFMTNEALRKVSKWLRLESEVHVCFVRIVSGNQEVQGRRWAEQAFADQLKKRKLGINHQSITFRKTKLTALNYLHLIPTSSIPDYMYIV